MCIHEHVFHAVEFQSARGPNNFTLFPTTECFQQTHRNVERYADQNFTSKLDPH